MNVVLLEPGYILHVRDYRESSLLLRILSLHHGRLDLIAKGAKRNNNRDRHLYQPWQRLLLSWRQRSELGALTGIELEHCPKRRERAEFLYCGFYLNEILLRLLHRQEPCKQLFDAYERALAALDQEQDRDSSLRYFEKQLLQELGYGLILDRDRDHNRPLAADRQYFYAYESGPQSVETAPDGPGLRLSGQTLLALHSETLAQAAPECRREAGRLLRTLLQRQLGQRRLFSRTLYRAWLGKRDNGAPPPQPQPPDPEHAS